MLSSAALALLIITIVCALLPPFGIDQRAQAIVRVIVLRVAKRLATPIPQPRATPVPAHVTTHRIAVQQPRPRIVDPGASRPQRVARVSHVRATQHAASGKPIWDIGYGGHAAAGSGTAASGSGSGGAPAGEQPCGAVDFVSTRAAVRDPASGLYVRNGIVVVVHFPDGHTEDAKLDWPWHYRDPNFDPFHQAPGAVPMLFQFPPPEMRASEPPLVQYIMAHSTSEGGTELDACPNEPPAEVPASLPPRR
jgi:hypothetical protein